MPWTGPEQSLCQRELFCKVFLRLLRIRFDTSGFLPYTLLFVRGSFAQAVARRGYLTRAVGRIFTPGTLQDGLGAKSGRNGTPVPQSRVSLSELKPRAEFCLLECVRGFLLVSGIAVSLSAWCALARYFARKARAVETCVQSRAEVVSANKEGRLCRHFRNW